MVSKKKNKASRSEHARAIVDARASGGRQLSLEEKILAGEFKTRDEEYFALPRGKFTPAARKELRKKLRRKRWEEEARLYDTFKEACIKEVGLTGHPKAGVAFEMAWDNQHSYGHLEVLRELHDLAALMLP